VSTVTGSKQVSYVALELTGGKDNNESCDFGKSPRHRGRADQGLDMGRELIPAALRSSWSMLGHYAGNQAAVTGSASWFFGTIYHHLASYDPGVGRPMTHRSGCFRGGWHRRRTWSMGR
jgi:hypothetical protein